MFKKVVPMDISKVLNCSQTYEDLCIKIRHSGGFTCENENDLAMLSWKSCRVDLLPSWKGKYISSIIINKTNLSVVALGNPQVLQNDYCVVTQACIDHEPFVITELYDAKEIIMFHHNSQWNIVTNGSFALDIPSFREMNIIDLWEDCLENKKDFYACHDTEKIYVYNLVHHKDRHVIDYTWQLGEEYKRLILISTRDKKTFDMIPLNQININKYVSVAMSYEDFSMLDTYNVEDDATYSVLDLKRAGVRVRLGEKLVDLHTTGFKTYVETSDIATKPCTSEHYLGLYQKNTMDTYLSKFNGETFFMSKDGNAYQIKGLIDSLFKILTSEILFLFKLLWDVRFGSAKEEYKDVYASLPSEYKKVFYILRGIYFSKKVSANTNNKYVTVKTVYDMLKKMEPITLVQLVKERYKILFSPDKQNRLFKIFDDFKAQEDSEKTSKVIDYAMSFIVEKTS